MSDPGGMEADPSVVAKLKLGRRRRRRWPWVLAAVTLTLVCAGICGALRSGARHTTWETEPAEVGDLELTVVAVGKLEPLNTVQIGSELSGILSTVEVDANDPVTVGQVLATLDTTLLDAQARQARAQVAAAEATLMQSRVQATVAKRDLTRAESLHASGGVARATLDDARSTSEQADAAVALSRAQLLQARAALEAAEVNLVKTVIVSPIDGVVLERKVEAGQSVVSSLQAATLFTLAQDLTQMRASVEVDEAYIGRMQVGQAATFTVSAFPDRVFDAQVTKVHMAPIAERQVVTYAAELRLDNPDLLLLPGMTATAVIVTDQLTGVLLAPNAGLRYAPPGKALPPPPPRDGKRVARLWTLDGDTPRPIEVVAGATDGRHSVIVEGEVQAGDPVITDSRRGGR